METLTILLGIAIVGFWFYKAGKRIGSRKGYGIGRARARRKR